MEITKKRKIKIVNKKRFILSCFFIIIICACLGLAINKLVLLGISESVQASNNKGEIPISIIEEPKEDTNKFIVVLDAGHGGIDKGAIQAGLYEKDLTLKIAESVKENLISKGCNVLMTREKDLGPSLKERYMLANSKNADVFVSIHVNSNKESIHKGVATYYYDVNGVQEKERKELAKAIQMEIVKSDNWKDRQIFKQNIAVLRGSNMPCALVECGFITNSEDRDKLTKEAVIENFGRNIAQGILNYLNTNIKHE